MKRLVHAILGSALVLVTFWLAAPPAKAQFAYLPVLQNGHLPLCRLGINGTLGSYPLKPLRLGWYLDYGAGSGPRPREMLAYYPMLRLDQTGNGGYTYSLSEFGAPITPDELRAHVNTKRGTYWFIGNEPDRIIFQDDIDPNVYAQAYHELYNIIKTQDPSAKIVAGAIVQPTPLRLQYLDIVLNTYSQLYGQPMPVDVWAFHNFILNEASCEVFGPDQCWGAGIPPGVDASEGLRIDAQENDSIELFKQQVIRFRQWMADRGYRNTPAFLSEFGVLIPKNLGYDPEFDETRVNNFMNATFDFLLNTTDPNIGYPGDENRLVQRFAWYSVDDNVDHNGFLFDRNLSPQSARTVMGDNFVNYANSMGRVIDFFPSDLHVVGTPVVNQGTADVTLEVTVGNTGNLAAEIPATVRFFNGNPNSGGEQIGSDKTVGLQGCGEQGNVSIEWESVPSGNYTVFVQVLATPGAEADQSDNLSSVAVAIP